MLLYWDYVLYPLGGSGVPCPPFSVVVAPSCTIYGPVCTAICLMVLSFSFMFRISLSDPMGWGGGLAWYGDLMARLPEQVEPGAILPLKHCTLILCTGTLDPHMHRCVARTKVMVILLLTYPHALE